MFWGLVLSATALALMVIWALFQIRRVNRTIEKVDRTLDGDNPARKK